MERRWNTKPVLIIERLAADREWITLLTNDIEIDVKSIALKIDDPGLQVQELKVINEQLKEHFLDGADLPNQDLFQQWLTDERLDIERLRGKLLAHLSSHPDITPPEQLKWTQHWKALEPYNSYAATQLLTQMVLPL